MSINKIFDNDSKVSNLNAYDIYDAIKQFSISIK